MVIVSIDVGVLIKTQIQTFEEWTVFYKARIKSIFSK